MKADFCCSILTENIVEAGRKGFSVIPFKHEDDLYTNDLYSFLLQFRSMDFAADNKCIMAQRAIAYCPWCGTELHQLTRINEAGLEYYAKRNQKLII
ncbi:hypothetical protein LL912_11610 [Niabella sp. CC-SYL272]|uniref:hypothetical protein n=1 Tax=Niabella agricola TaxID=2891571 RepID=UPI001F276A56|nr:hypothetical protein [Niabella agricola]MCF3109423.1 hypothetical protein [Niabella agricola]